MPDSQAHMTSIGVRSSVDTDTDKVWGWTWSLFGVGVLRDDDESDKRYNAEKKTLSLYQTLWDTYAQKLHKGDGSPVLSPMCLPV